MLGGFVLCYIHVQKKRSYSKEHIEKCLFFLNMRVFHFRGDGCPIQAADAGQRVLKFFDMRALDPDPPAREGVVHVSSKYFDHG